MTKKWEKYIDYPKNPRAVNYLDLNSPVEQIVYCNTGQNPQIERFQISRSVILDYVTDHIVRKNAFTIRLFFSNLYALDEFLSLCPDNIKCMLVDASSPDKPNKITTAHNKVVLHELTLAIHKLDNLEEIAQELETLLELKSAYTYEEMEEYYKVSLDHMLRVKSFVGQPSTDRQIYQASIDRYFNRVLCGGTDFKNVGSNVETLVKVAIQLKTLNAENNALQQELKTLNAENSALQQELKTLKTENSASQQERHWNNLLEKTTKDLTDENICLKQELESLRSQVALAKEKQPKSLFFPTPLVNPNMDVNNNNPSKTTKTNRSLFKI